MATNLIPIVIATVVVTVLGGGIGWLFWLKTRPKKVTWNARVFQLSDGIKPFLRDKKGEIISKVRLSDLKPYTKDVIEKIEKDPGIVIYKLQKLNKPVPAVTANTVDYWGEKDKEVSVVMVDDNYTLMNKGYDKKTGRLIFNPIPHDRINLMRAEIVMRKDRLTKEKDILAAIMPWITTGILVLGLVAIAYFQGSAAMKISDNALKAEQTASSTFAVAADRLVAIMNYTGNWQDPAQREVKKEDPPPMIKDT